MNAASWSYEEMTARAIQIEEYLAVGEVSTNLSVLAEEVSDALKVIELLELKDLIAELKAFYIAGTFTVQ